MSEAAVAADPGGDGIGKKQLCEELGWSRSRLDRRLNEDETFPVLSRGNQAGGWSFDLVTVKAYLEPERSGRSSPRTWRRPRAWRPAPT
jgi:hypothetical protein